MLFASAYQAGNDCPSPRRTRIVLDVLDDVRRRYSIDPDRTWIGGFSGGGRVSCAIAFALPELFGGVISVCASGDLREEPWLRRRVMDRLNVAFITGESDFNRGEVERFRGPMLRDMGVPTKVWTFPGMGHSLPPADALSEIHDWLEEGTASRRKFAATWPASRIAGDDAPSREQWAQRLLDEAEQRVKSDKTLYDGLMQLQGASIRWNDVAAGRKARERLVEFDSRPEHPWEADDIAEQRRFLIARARALDAYASGPLPEQYAKNRPDMLQAAIQLWKMVIADGENAEAVRQAEARVPQLEQLAKGEQ
jgi:pimeloyl-ACP methyl ester carboxylesterase